LLDCKPAGLNVSLKLNTGHRAAKLALRQGI